MVMSTTITSHTDTFTLIKGRGVYYGLSIVFRPDFVPMLRRVTPDLPI